VCASFFDSNVCSDRNRVLSLHCFLIHSTVSSSGSMSVDDLAVLIKGKAELYMSVYMYVMDSSQLTAEEW